MAEGEKSLMLITICKHSAQLWAGGAAFSSAEVASCSTESLLQEVFVSESKLQEEVSTFQYVTTFFEEHCEMEGRDGGCTLHLWDSASETNCILADSFQKTRAQCNQELTDLP